ncbi:hypothetical protein [Immundisolibacter sp.]
MAFNGQIIEGQPYYTIIIYCTGAEVAKHIHEGSPLEDCFSESHNWFKTEKEAQKVADQINKYLSKLKGENPL